MGEMFSEIDLNQQQRLKCAFDAQGLLNPGKVFPTLHRCADERVCNQRNDASTQAKARLESVPRIPRNAKSVREIMMRVDIFPPLVETKQYSS
jgi:hypothetical protein